MSDPKDTKRDDKPVSELDDAQLDAASGGVPVSKFAGDGSDDKLKKTAD